MFQVSATQLNLPHGSQEEEKEELAHSSVGRSGAYVHFLGKVNTGGLGRCEAEARVTGIGNSI